MDSKQFAPGIVILVKKDYGSLIFFLLSVLIAIGLTNLMCPSVLKYFRIREYSGYAIILRIVFWLICIGVCGTIAFWFQPALFKNSEFRMRFDQIILFEDYLIGEIRTKGGTVEEKLKFTDIVHFIQEEDGCVSLTFKDDFSPVGIIKMDYNRRQDYKMSRKLSKIQKKELVSFLNIQVKNHLDIKHI
jgi:hypothetical protein